MLEYLLLASIGQTEAFPALATHDVLASVICPCTSSPSSRPAKSLLPPKREVSEGNVPRFPTQRMPTPPPTNAPILPNPAAESSSMPSWQQLFATSRAQVAAGLHEASEPMPFGSSQPTEASLMPEMRMKRGTNMEMPSWGKLISSAAGAALLRPPKSARGLPFFPQRGLPDTTSSQHQSPQSPQLLDLSTRAADHVLMQSRPLSSALQLASGNTTEASTHGSRPVSATFPLQPLVLPAPPLNTVYQHPDDRETRHGSSGSALGPQSPPPGFRLEKHCSGSGVYQVPVFDSILPRERSDSMLWERSASIPVAPHEIASIPGRGSGASNMQPSLRSALQDSAHSAQIAPKRPASGELTTSAKRQALDPIERTWSQMYHDFLQFTDSNNFLPQAGPLGSWTLAQLQAACQFSAKLQCAPEGATSVRPQEITYDQFQSLVRVPIFMERLRILCQPGTVPHMWNVEPMPRASKTFPNASLPSPTITTGTASAQAGQADEGTMRDVPWGGRGGSTAHSMRCATVMSGAEASSAPSTCTGMVAWGSGGGDKRWPARSALPVSEPFLQSGDEPGSHQQL